MSRLLPKSKSNMALYYIAALMATIVLPQALGLQRFVGTEMYFSIVVYISSFLLVFLGFFGGYRSVIVNTLLLLVTIGLTFLLFPETSLFGDIDADIAVVEWPPKITVAYLLALLNQIYTWFK